MTKVALLKCGSYELDLLKDRIAEALSLIRFDPARLRGAKVALKPNLLSAISADSAVVTHPLFFRASAEMVLDHGGKPILMESPAVASLDNALEKAGYRGIVEGLSIPVAPSGRAGTFSHQAGKMFRYFEVIPEVLDADFILNMPKFKTHELTFITGAVKNLFGLVPGMRKSQMHIRFSDTVSFSEFILDLYDAVVRGINPPGGILHLMDAVMALEGRGPGSSGTPRRMGLILAGEDGIAVDYVAARVAGLDMRKAVTIMNGFSRRIGVSGPHDIEVLGEGIEQVEVPGFVPAETGSSATILQKVISSRMVRDLFIARPIPDGNTCILCYQCMKICPANAVSKSDAKERVPVFDYRKCIRCFCCSEVCPEAAIHLHRGVLQWMLRL
jgi:uncharacterized protein (DUF362 family)/ferredoxin-like protein FixX